MTQLNNILVFRQTQEKQYPCRKAMYRSSDKNTCQPGWRVKSVQRRSLLTQKSFSSWHSVTYHGLECKTTLYFTDLATYREKWYKKTIFTPTLWQKYPHVNCTSIFLLQCILKPFSTTFRTLKIPQLYLTFLFFRMHTHTHTDAQTTNTHLKTTGCLLYMGSLHRAFQQRNTLRISERWNSAETSTLMFSVVPLCPV